MIRTLGITYEHKVEHDVPLDQLMNGQYAWIWADFMAPTPEESHLLDTLFHFHPLAIEDCLHVLQRPKLDFYDDYQFMVVHSLDALTLDTVEVDLFVGHHYLVTYHHKDLPEVNSAWEKVVRRANERRIWARGPMSAAYLVIDDLVDLYFPCVFSIEDELDELEKKGSRESVEDLMNQVFDLRSRLLKLRRTIVPMRDLMYRVVNSEHIQGDKEPRAYFADIYDHLLKLTDMIEADREMTADLRDSYISLNSNRMNSIMKTLTVITTIFMPLTLIAGIYGMNFVNMPELGLKYGYFFVIGGMIVLTVAMIMWFNRRGWFK
ncbi:magnesium transporter [Paenibacillus shirakamiensis]|uniref:Magnesium transport protein CorA n=1 Tax=Paenibacillus shirakamiensis TaxID=1265935 RepID=A0ABS4JGL9_9BACL|nr:magnesium/cobalt transporter CorA [Paenibacillus shirakamiensis]MBP2000868.1 magnesium transporter [Paenibacillus shirakamiensis]